MQTIRQDLELLEKVRSAWVERKVYATPSLVTVDDVLQGVFGNQVGKKQAKVFLSGPLSVLAVDIGETVNLRGLPVCIPCPEEVPMPEHICFGEEELFETLDAAVQDASARMAGMRRSKSSDSWSADTKNAVAWLHKMKEIWLGRAAFAVVPKGTESSGTRFLLGTTVTQEVRVEKIMLDREGSLAHLSDPLSSWRYENVPVSRLFDSIDDAFAEAARLLKEAPISISV